MGYFVLTKDDTPKELLKACIANIQLYIDGMENNDTPIYLLEGFAASMLRDAISKEQERMENNK